MPGELLHGHREGAVKHWQETGEILSQLTAEAEAGRRAAIATVIRISGSAYRRVKRPGLS